MKIVRDVPIYVIEKETLISDQLAETDLRDERIININDYEIAFSNALNDRPSVIVLDIDRPFSSNIDRSDAYEGLNWLKELVSLDLESEVIVVSRKDDPHLACRAFQMGAFDFCPQPSRSGELSGIIKRARYHYRVRRAEMRSRTPVGRYLIGQSAPMQKIYDMVDKVSKSDVTVLLLGDSGTGKELVARAIYQNSLRKDQPFVTINFSAIPETLLESELFGHEKGSFTGAHKQHIGRLEAAQGGTVFLDEIGEIPLNVQVKLLRFLQEREIERVGGKEPVPMDVRVIAATNKNLKEEVKRGRFREDLFFRLSIVPIQLPGLKDCPEDIILLANHFLDKYRKEASHKIAGLSDELVSVMLSYKWPGNVRELESKIRRGIILSNGRLLTPVDLGFAEQTSSNEELSLKEIRNQAESKAIRLSLELTQGNISKAAGRLRISRPALHDLLKKLDIDPKSYKR